LRVWRLTRRIHSAVDGEGSRLFGGRWSPPGVPVVYTSATASLAALEYLVHLTVDQAPDDLVLISVDLPQQLPVANVAVRDLPADWRSYPAPENLAQLGRAWAGELAAPALRVPSAVVPHEANYLLNPRHPRFDEMVIGPPEQFFLDPRLWRRPSGRPGQRRR
jgi:RES domain-containing protein